MKQHTVPQNIMSVEFKIFGDLTVRQFIYITIAGGLAFILYLTFLPAILKFPLITVCIIGGLLITFAKVNDRPFDQWINNFVTAVLMPTQRVWKKNMELPGYLLEEEQVVQGKKKQKDDRYNKVMTYIHSRSLPTDEMYKANTVLDIEEIKMLTNIDKLMRQSTTSPMAATANSAVGALDSSLLAMNAQNLAQPAQPVVSSVSDPAAPVMPPAATPVPDPSAVYTPPAPTNEEKENTDDNLPINPGISSEDVDRIDALLSTDFLSETTPDKAVHEAAGTSVTPLQGALADIAMTKMQITPPVQEPVVQAAPVQDVSPVQPDVPVDISSEEKKVEEVVPVQEPSAEETITVPDATPVMEIPNPGDGIDEKKEPQDAVFTIEPNTVIKLDELMNLTSSADVVDNELKSINTLPPIPPKEESLDNESSNPVSADEETTANAVPLDPNMQTLLEENKHLKEELEHMKDVKEDEPPVPSANEREKKLFGHMPDFIRYPNVISGVVIDSNEKLLEDVVVILKDKSTKRIMRALKSNILGQFYSRNPLMNGTYLIEANKEGTVFETATVELKGEPVQPVIIAPRKFENTIESGQNFNLLHKE